MKQLRVATKNRRERAEFEIKLSQGRVRIDNCSGRSLISTARRHSAIQRLPPKQTAALSRAPDAHSSWPMSCGNGAARSASPSR